MYSLGASKVGQKYLMKCIIVRSYNVACRSAVIREGVWLG